MPEFKVKYDEIEILEIFKEQHRLCSPLDPEAESYTEITGEMTIDEWRWANDLLGWKKLSEFLNQEFRIQINQDEWKRVLEPPNVKRLEEVCQLISKYAKKVFYEPKNLFGKPCLKAGVFLTIKKNLKDKGVNVSELKPSSSLSEYMEKNFSPILEEITLSGTKPIDKIEIRKKELGFWKTINIFDFNKYEILTGEIKTFRDLTEKIIEEKTKTGYNNI